MNDDQIALVQSTWERIVPISETAADLFYSRLFELDPSLRSLFTSDIKEQGSKFMQMISVAVVDLDRIEEIAPSMQDMGSRHVEYGVKDEHYDTVGAALLWTLEQGLGESFTPDVKEAWIEAYALPSNVMKEAATETY